MSSRVERRGGSRVPAKDRKKAVNVLQDARKRGGRGDRKKAEKYEGDRQQQGHRLF